MTKKIMNVECDSDAQITLQVSKSTIIGNDGERFNGYQCALVVVDETQEDTQCIPVFMTSSQIDVLIGKLRTIQERIRLQTIQERIKRDHKIPISYNNM